MPIIDVQPVTRKGVKLLISLFGLSETGKTYSGLKLMEGIQPDPAKRGLLDTEGGQRGRIYADVIPGGFMYGSLTPPFTPERYMEALQDFVAAGVDTLVVDSASHVWFGAGGVLDMADQSTTAGQGKWSGPKRRLAKLTQQWLGCGINIILCSRAKQPLIEVPNPNKPGKMMLVPGEVVPVQEKNLRYDMTIMAQMLGDGHFSITKRDGGKCPGSLRDVFDNHPKMDSEMGVKLREWAGGIDMMTPEHRKMLMDADTVAENGVAALRKWIDDMTKEDRLWFKPHAANFISIAKAADDDRTRAATEAEEAARENAEPFAQGKVFKDAGGNTATQLHPDSENVGESESPEDALKGLLERLEAVPDADSLADFLASPETAASLSLFRHDTEAAADWMGAVADAQESLRGTHPA